jgi:hypothetical protein
MARARSLSMMYADTYGEHNDRDANISRRAILNNTNDSNTKQNLSLYFDIEQRNGLLLFGIMTCHTIDRFRYVF